MIAFTLDIETMIIQVAGKRNGNGGSNTVVIQEEFSILGAGFAGFSRLLRALPPILRQVKNSKSEGLNFPAFSRVPLLTRRVDLLYCVSTFLISSLSQSPGDTCAARLATGSMQH